MYVSVTLFKSGLTPANIFAGVSSDSRRTDLFTLPHLTISRCPYNPNDPFKIVGNAFTFKRAWDYAEYAFYDSQTSDTPLMYKYYFITEFVYVSDTVTRIMVTEDTLGGVFWNLSSTEILPEAATYKLSERPGRALSSKTTGGNMLAENRLFGGYKTINLGNETFVCGAVILTVTQNNALYIENGTTYAFNTVLVPFVISTETLRVNMSKAPGTTGVTFWYYPTSNYVIIKSVSDLYRMGQITSSDAKVQNVSISFDIAFDMDFVAVDASTVRVGNTADFSAYSIPDGSGLNFLRLRIYNEKSFTLPIVSPSAADYTYRSPYRELRFEWGDNLQIVDPLVFADVSGSFQTMSVTVQLSNIPPYSITIKINCPWGRAKQKAIKIDTTIPYPLVTDSYSEWLRNNYNATVTGLKVNQKLRQQNKEVDYVSGFINQTMRTGAALASGNPLALGGAALSITSYGADLIASEQKLANQVAAENELLDLKLADLQNLTDVFNAGNSLVAAYLTTNVLSVTLYNNSLLSNMKKADRLFGVTTNEFTTLARKHRDFDYYKANSINYKANGVNLSRSERADVIQSLKSGVRVWYNVEQLLNFDTTNPEV